MEKRFSLLMELQFCLKAILLAFNHEEADTRMLVHMLDAVANDAIAGLVWTVDMDVIVILWAC